MGTLAGGLGSLLRAMAPDSFEDISAVIALYRPGPMGENAHNDYADRKNGRKAVEPIHPELSDALQDILGDTYGLIVYQEQVMAIAQKLAGFTLGRADLLRKAMGKKNKEILASSPRPGCALGQHCDLSWGDGSDDWAFEHHFPSFHCHDSGAGD